MSAITASALNVHCQGDVRAKSPNQPDVVADDILPAPFLDDLLGIERIAVVDGAGEVLLGSVDPVRRQKFGGAQDGDIAEQFGTNLILSAIAAVVLEIDRTQAHAIGEHCEQRIGFVVRVCGSLHERARNTEFADARPSATWPLFWSTIE